MPRSPGARATKVSQVSDTPTPPADFAFFVSPIGEKGSGERKRADEVLEFVIEPACNEVRLLVVRADQMNSPGRITEQIVQAIAACRVLLADVSGRNPNVHYELGIAHTLNKPVIMIADSTDSLIFDTKDERTIILGDDGKLGAKDAEEGRGRLRSVLDAVLDADYVPDSMVTRAAGTQTLAALASDEDPVASAIDRLEGRISVAIDWRLANEVDVDRLRGLIRVAALRRHIHPDDVESLVDGLTSPDHDRWVRGIQAELREPAPAPQYDMDEEPF
jgi:hypothetical protein